MRRPRLEIVLVAALGLALVALLLLRPGEEDRSRRVLDLGGPGSCGPALHDAEGLEAPARSDAASVAGLVERLRGLRFEEVPEPTYLAPDRFTERLTEFGNLGQEEIELEERVLRLLGAIPEGYDLRSDLMDLAGEQVIGLYDPRTGDLLVRAADRDALGPDEVLTLAHELEHALADQVLGLPDLETLVAKDPEAASAGRALVEGDAMLVTQLYASIGLSFSEQFSLLLQIPGLRSLQETPHFVVRSLAFPYTEGAAFACALYREGGWEAVDAAYAAPPTTTAHILFPERYLAGEATRRPREPADLPDRWEPVGPLSLGAADLLFLLEAPGDDPAAAVVPTEERAAGWDGGLVRVWTSGEDTALAAALLQREGAADLCSTLAEWYLRAFPDSVDWRVRSPILRVANHDGGAAALRCQAGQVRLGLGPDLSTAVRASA